MSDSIITFEAFEPKNSFIKTSNNHQIKLIVTNISGHQVALEYRCLPNNRASDFANKIHVWKGETVLWSGEPDKSEMITNNAQWGGLVISGLNIGRNDYTIGYSVGADSIKTAASVHIPGTWDDGAPALASLSDLIEVTAVGDTYVSFRYETLNGYDPYANGAWVGLWERMEVPYPAGEAMASTIIPYRTERGEHYIDKINLASGHDYAIGLFLGNKDARSSAVCLAASCSFSY